jgi:shikimate kinase
MDCVVENMFEKHKNIILIGMPAVGKSTVGVLLAKRLGWSFLDTDLIIQVGESEKLQDILDSQGMENFCALEEQYVLTVHCENHVIATGGSVIYGEKAMEHLKSMGTVIHLDLYPHSLEKRLKNLSSRGVVMAKGQDIETLYTQRHPLYSRYADMTIECNGLSMDEIVNQIESFY